MTVDTSRLRAVLPTRTNYEDLIWRVHTSAPALVLSDLHIPMMDEDLFEVAVNKGVEEGCEKVFVVGDLYNMNPYSRHGPGLNSKVEVMSQARDVAHAAIDVLAENFHEVIISVGNHDEWWIKHNEGHMGMVDLIRWTYPEGGEYLGGIGYNDDTDSHILVSDLPTVYATINGVEWVLEHPGFYSRNRTKTAVDVATKHRRNAAVGHVHHWGQTVTDGGDYLAVELGGLFKAEFFDYVYQKTSRAPSMVSGYAIIDGELCQLYRG